jgi:exodeoxyribonuclease VII small subunit
VDKKEELTFEQAMEKLERIVESLEEGDVPLEEAIAKYKEGMDLAKICHQKLKNAEEQLTQILKDNGEVDNFVIEEE